MQLVAKCHYITTDTYFFKNTFALKPTFILTENNVGKKINIEMFLQSVLYNLKH